MITWDPYIWLGLYEPLVVNRPVLFALMKVLISQVKYVYEQFSEFRDETRYSARINGQTIVLEAHLNNVFDDVDRGIVISTSQWVGGITFSPRAATDDVMFSPRVDDDPVEFRNLGSNSAPHDFTVTVPVGILSAAQEKQIKAIVAKFQVAGFRSFYQYDDLTPF